jgi:hypothetical protein
MTEPSSQSQPSSTSTSPSSSSGCYGGASWEPAQQLAQTLNEIQCMCAHATSQGIALPSATTGALAALMADVGYFHVDSASAPTNVAAWTAQALTVHAELSALVAPAKPSSLESNPKLTRLRQWPRHYPTVAAIAAAGFIGLGLFIVGAGIATRHAGPGLNLWGQMACAGAALLGSAFFSTFEASKYIVARTYDARYEGVYFIRFLLGVVAGLILSNFGSTLMPGAHTPTGMLGLATLALLGGYSSDAVNRILMRVSDTLSAAVEGTDTDELKAKDEQLKAARTALEALRAHDETAAAQRIDRVLSPPAGQSLDPRVREALEGVKGQLQHRLT